MCCNLLCIFQKIVSLSWCIIQQSVFYSCHVDCLIGLVVKKSASRVADPGFEFCLRHWDFSGSSHTTDPKIAHLVATLPDAWCFWFSTGTGLPGVSILWLGEMESLICSLCLSVAACRFVWADPSLRYRRMLLRQQASKQPTTVIAGFYPVRGEMLGHVIDAKSPVFVYFLGRSNALTGEDYQCLCVWRGRVGEGFIVLGSHSILAGRLPLL